MYICIVCVCIYICVYVGMYVRKYVYICIYMCMYVCMNAFMYVYMNVYTYACMYVCMYVFFVKYDLLGMLLYTGSTTCLFSTIYCDFIHSIYHILLIQCTHRIPSCAWL